MDLKGKKILFVTGNDYKKREIEMILGKENVVFCKFDLEEIQGTPEEIVVKKCEKAYEKMKEDSSDFEDQYAVMVEDTSLFFEGLGNLLPGPYIKWFEPLGNEELSNMLKDKPREATAKCYLACKTSLKSPPHVIVNAVEGVILDTNEWKDRQSSSSNGFGWDEIFQPSAKYQHIIGNTSPDKFQTFSQMSSQSKNMISHRFNALCEFQKIYQQAQ